MGEWKIPLWGCFDDIGACKFQIKIRTIISLKSSSTSHSHNLPFQYLNCSRTSSNTLNDKYLQKRSIKAANTRLQVYLTKISGLITYFVPCWTFGKVAESVGEDCLIYGILGVVPIVYGYFRLVSSFVLAIYLSLLVVTLCLYYGACVSVLELYL